MPPAEREAAANAIWLCNRCSRLVDNDTSTYSVHDLTDWKAQAIARAQRALETGKVPSPGPSERALQHDADVFAKSDGLMTEAQLRFFLDNILSGHAMMLNSDEPLVTWSRFLLMEGNQYIIPALRSAAKNVRDGIEQLANFIGTHFPFIGASEKLALYPDLNIDRGGSGHLDEMLRYDRFAMQLNEIGWGLRDAYIAYRKTVKDHLFL